MSASQDLTSGGGGQTVSVTVNNATVQIKTGAGRLQKVLVTTTTAAVLTFYDGAGSSPTNGTTIIGVIPSGATAGSMFIFNMPASKGLYASGAAGAGVVTVSFN